MNHSTKNDNVETLRPLARTLARELSQEEVGQVGGSGVCPPGYSRSGCDPWNTGDWDQHH